MIKIVYMYPIGGKSMPPVLGLNPAGSNFGQGEEHKADRTGLAAPMATVRAGDTVVMSSGVWSGLR